MVVAGALLLSADAVSMKQKQVPMGGLAPGTQYNGLEAPVIEMGPEGGAGDADGIAGDEGNEDLAKIAQIFAKEPPSASGGGGEDDAMEMFGNGVDPLAPCDDDDAGAAPEAAGAVPVEGDAGEAALGAEAAEPAAGAGDDASAAAGAAPADTGKLGAQIKVLEDLIKHASQISALIPDKQKRLDEMKAKYAAITAAAKKAAEEKKIEGQKNILATIDKQLEAVTGNVQALKDAKKKVEEEMKSIKAGGDSADAGSGPGFLF